MNDTIVLGRRFGAGADGEVPEMSCQRVKEIIKAINNGGDGLSPDEITEAVEHARLCKSCNPKLPR
ncbi:MAG: hypothetical protein Q7S32_04145 [bacterium]|nr:hypothetical protein [bacterium]